MDWCHTNGPGLASTERGRNKSCKQNNDPSGSRHCCLTCKCISPRTQRPCKRKVCFGNVCWQHAKSHYGLRVKRVPKNTCFDSQGTPVRGLGRGLFATVDMREGCIINELKGKYMTKQQVENEYPGDTLAPYAVATNFQSGPQYFYDVKETTCNLARFANDARGLYKRTGRRLVKIKNNAHIDEAQRPRGPPVLVATKNIKAGDQIFTSYGSDYWASRPAPQATRGRTSARSGSTRSSA